MRFRILKPVTTGIGGNVYCFTSLPSTNSTAFELARDGAPEGTVVVARSQSAGRGRLGHSWHSPPGGLYLSFILKPEKPLARMVQLGLAAAVALARAIDSATGLRSAVRWPNDIFIGGRKAAGVLVEARTSGERVEATVVGVGVNVNQSRFPGELADIATSLAVEARRKISRSALARALLSELASVLPVFFNEGLEPLLDELNGRSDVAGRRLTVGSGSETVTGVAGSVGADGGLKLRTGDGRTVPVLSGSIVAVG